MAAGWVPTRRRWLADLRTGTLLEPVPVGAKVRRDGCAYKLRWTRGPERAVIRRVFREAEGGLSLRAIADGLNRDRVTPPSARLPPGAYQGHDEPHWTNLSVRALLVHPIYKGDLVFPEQPDGGPEPVPHTRARPLGSEPIGYKNFSPGAPITRNQWDRVRKVLRGHPRQGGRKRSNVRYLLGSLVTCAACGARCHGHTLRPRRPDGPAYVYYTHGRAHQAGTCVHAGAMAPAERLHRFALAATERALIADGFRPEIEGEVVRQRASAEGPEGRRAVAEARRFLAEHEATAEQASENAARTRGPARKQHLKTAAKFARLADRARADLARHVEAGARANAASARLAGATLGRADLAAAFARADAAGRKQLVQTIVRGAVVDFVAGAAEFVVVVPEQRPATGAPTRRGRAA